MPNYRVFSSALALVATAALPACAGHGATPALGVPGQATAGVAKVRRHEPPHPPRKTHTVTAGDRGRAIAAGWRQIAAPAPFGSAGADTPLLMTDGTVMIHVASSPGWFSLAPDSQGNYVRGKWTQAASMSSSYGPLYFSSAVLPDGKLIVNGGEYNFGSQVETTLGAIYDPPKNAWTNVSPPSGWSTIGDATSAVLANGTYMLADCCSASEALFNESTMTWTATGTGKADANSEEGWTLLPSGDLLTADVFNAPNSERYHPSSGAWSSAGSLPANLTQGDEMGPQVLRSDGSVFVAGANSNTAFYNVATGAWSAGPQFPSVASGQLDIADGPATLIPNGSVLMAASPGVYNTPAYFLKLNGAKFKTIGGPPNAPNDSSYNVRLLLLPTGQVLETDGSNDVEIYSPRTPPLGGLAPTIASVPTTIARGNTYTLKGVHLSGYSQGNAYGDDAQMATNYPLVRITTSTGRVIYARTHGFSSMAVASPSTVSTKFDVPSSAVTGAATLVVIANGIASSPVSVTIQ
ncbi:MAG: kelch repeat-containing protein [Candidatus Tumulicola sp.]